MKSKIKLSFTPHLLRQLVKIQTWVIIHDEAKYIHISGPFTSEDEEKIVVYPWYCIKSDTRVITIYCTRFEYINYQRFDQTSSVLSCTSVLQLDVNVSILIGQWSMFASFCFHTFVYQSMRPVFMCTWAFILSYQTVWEACWGF